jgi:hypothetical protein
MGGSGHDRRNFPRVNAPVFWRPVGLPLFGFGRRRTVDVSVGGARVYSDEPIAAGTPFALELGLPDGGTVTCRAEVVWAEELPAGAPARYDIGLKFTEISTEALVRLQAVLVATDD